MNRRRHEVKKGRGGKNDSPRKVIRKRVLGKVLPAGQNRANRGSPVNEQEGMGLFDYSTYKH